MKYLILILIAVSTTAGAQCRMIGCGEGEVSTGEKIQSTLPFDSTGTSVQSGIRTSGQIVSPAETAALLAQHNVNAKANANRWEDLVCSLRPVKGKTIEGILFRNEIPFWYNCND